jgi:hypothetical protein
MSETTFRDLTDEEPLPDFSVDLEALSHEQEQLQVRLEWYESDAWRGKERDLESMVWDAGEALVVETDPTMVARLQGRISVLRELLGARESTRNRMSAIVNEMRQLTQMQQGGAADGDD